MKTDDSSGNKLETSGNSFKPPFCLIDIEQKRKMSTTTRQEKERVVIDLYHNQGKTVHDIAKEAPCYPDVFCCYFSRPGVHSVEIIKEELVLYIL